MNRLTLSPDERAELFIQAATNRGLTPVIVEKDYWVCVALNVLFGEPQPVELIFKGGTSLSKGYGLIDRFSEDVDLAFDRKGLGFSGDQDPENPDLSKNRRKALVNQLTEAATAHINGAFRDDTLRRLAAILPDEPWSLEPDPADAKTLLFRYPASLTTQTYGEASYVASAIRLELGARSDQTPASVQSVTAIATEEFGETNSELASHDVPMLAAERTFWEKATLLHAEACRAQRRKDGRGMSRHLYDLVQLAKSEFGQRALRDNELRDRVVAHKSQYFASAQSRYDLFVPGSIRLLPARDALDDLRRDYDAMSVMFFSDQPKFEDLVQALTALEKTLNGTG